MFTGHNFPPKYEFLYTVVNLYSSVKPGLMHPPLLGSLLQPFILSQAVLIASSLWSSINKEDGDLLLVISVFPNAQNPAVYQ